MKGQRHNLIFIKEQYLKISYIFLDDYYNNNKEYHNIKCNFGHLFKQKYNSFVDGDRCPICKSINTGNRIRLSLDFVRQEYQKRGYEFLDKEYKGNHYKHLVKCKCGHIWKQEYNSFKQGHDCKECFKVKCKQTSRQRYGVNHHLQNKEIALRAAKAQNNITLKYHWSTKEELICKAGYESKVVDYLNSNKINYLWQPEVFQLSTGQTYRPDLYLIDEDKWIEIKGYMRPNALPKWEEFHNKIKPNSELWNKEKLKQLGIL
jgi:hypothetical protein